MEKISLPTFLIVFVFIFAHACNVTKVENIDSEAMTEKELIPDSYLDWKEKRVNALKRPFGWLSVCGLFWIDKDVSTLGSLKSNDFVFPNTAPEQIGTIIRKDSSYFLTTNPELDITMNGKEVKKTQLQTDASANRSLIEHGSFSWYLIERGNKIGVRLKDSLSDNRINFEGIEYFDYNHDLVVEAEVLPARENETFKIMNVLGQETEFDVGGRIMFEYGGATHTLVGQASGENWFIVLADDTTNAETYGGGRFLYLTVPKDSTKVLVDFNKAENPPCYFSDFATCPLPPKENHLTFAVYAGEKASN